MNTTKPEKELLCMALSLPVTGQGVRRFDHFLTQTPAALWGKKNKMQSWENIGHKLVYKYWHENKRLLQSMQRLTGLKSNSVSLCFRFVKE